MDLDEHVVETLLESWEFDIGVSESIRASLFGSMSLQGVVALESVDLLAPILRLIIYLDETYVYLSCVAIEVKRVVSLSLLSSAARSEERRVGTAWRG